MSNIITQSKTSIRTQQERRKSNVNSVNIDKSNNFSNGNMEEEMRRLRAKLAEMEAWKTQYQKVKNELMIQQRINEEVAKYKQINDEQRNPIDRLIQLIASSTGNDGAMDAIVTGFQKMNLEVKIPNFSSEGTGNPVEFLEEAESYYKIKKIDVTDQLIMLETMLKNRDKIWFDANKGDFKSYEEFKKSSLNGFHSIPVRVGMKNKWAAKIFRSSDGSLQSYFLKQIKEAKYFIPKLDTFEMNYTIVQQLPYKIGNSLATSDFNDTKAILQALAFLGGNNSNE